MSATLVEITERLKMCVSIAVCFCSGLYWKKSHSKKKYNNTQNFNESNAQTGHIFV